MNMMRQGLLLTFALALVVGGSAYLVKSQNNEWRPPQVVRIEGVESVGLSFSSGSFVSAAEKGAPLGLLLREGDYISSPGEPAPAPYRETDGQVLTVAFNDWSASIGGKTVSVMADDEGMAWLKQASDRQLADVRWVGLLDDVSRTHETTLSVLQRLTAASPNVELFCETDATMLKSLPLFQPRFIGIGEHPSADTLAALAKQTQVETVFMAAVEPGSLDVLTKFPKLRRLVIFNWDVEKTGPLPAGLANLKVLEIEGTTGGFSPSAVGAAPAGLEELSVPDVNDAADMKVFERWPNLRKLMLKIGKGSGDLSRLTSHQQLQWFNLPSTTTQEQFAAFANAHPQLTILDMTGNDNVKDLSPLMSLRGLNGLVLDDGYENLDVVQKLTSLRFLGISKKAWEASPEQVTAIRKALPDALVVRVDSPCLGSGWILLLIPALFAGWLLRQSRLASMAQAA